MRSGAVLGCLLGGLAACGGGSGVDLEIKSDVAIDSVEVFIANAICEVPVDPKAPDGPKRPCPTIAWIPGQEAPPGTTYLTTREAAGVELKLVPDKIGSSYTIHLEATTFFADPILIAVVGLDVQGQAVALGDLWYPHVPVHAAEHWTVTMKPVDPATRTYTDAPDADQPEKRVAVWGREGADGASEGSRCMVLQKWKDDVRRWESFFVVPESDPDCDGEATECSDYYFNLNQDLPGTTRVECLLHPAVTTGPCVVGGSPCRDGVSSDSTCMPPQLMASMGRTCVPDKLCDACTEPVGVAGCMEDALRSSGGITHVECKFEGNANGDACPVDHIGNMILLHVVGPCAGGFDLRPMNQPFTPGTKSVMIGQATFTGEAMSSAPSTCDIELTFAGTLDRSRREWMMLALHPNFTNGPTQLIPVRIELESFEVDCAQNGSVLPPCTGGDTIPNDTVSACGS